MKLTYTVFCLDPDAESLDPKDLYVQAKDVGNEEEAIVTANEMLDAGAESATIVIRKWDE